MRPLLAIALVLAAACGPIEDMFKDEDGKPIPREDCVAHLRECMASPLSKTRGNNPGESVCKLCHDICRVDRKWPDDTRDGKSCEWWSAR